jgi:hypothetical protein
MRHRLLGLIQQKIKYCESKKSLSCVNHSACLFEVENPTSRVSFSMLGLCFVLFWFQVSPFQCPEMENINNSPKNSGGNDTRGDTLEILLTTRFRQK